MKRSALCLLVFVMVTALAFSAGTREARVTTTADILTIEYWNDTSPGPPVTEDYPQNVVLREKFGFQVVGPTVPWQGGVEYFQQLQLRIAGGELPDVFLPWNQLEVTLADQGAILEISRLLEDRAPTLLSRASEDIWDIVRASSPDGQGIYFLPGLFTTPYGQGFIRKDWLDAVGMDVPTTLDEYVEVLRAFKAQDANRSGDPNDEIPTSGRQLGRWMDHLFMPFGVAMFEGFPEFHVYDGELTYSAVTPNMKAALAWIRDLYAEGLLDPEVFLNTLPIWQSKIDSNQVGSWFHMPMFTPSRLEAMAAVNPNAEIVNLPVLSAPGFEGAYFNKSYRRPEWVFSAAEPEKAARFIDFIEYYTVNQDAEFRGYEGLNYVIQDGREVRIPLDPAYRGPVTAKVLRDASYFLSSLGSYKPDDQLPFFQNAQRLVETSSATELAGQGLPPSIWDGYPDLRAHTLYFEYSARIIIGEWPLSRFDEFVERWYAQGGRQVTAAARAAHGR